MRIIIAVSVLSLAGALACSSTPKDGDQLPPTPPPQTVRISATGAAGVQGTSGTSDLTLTSTPNVGRATIEAAPDKVWTELVEVYKSLGIETSILDRPSRMIGNQSLKVRRRLGTVPLTRYIDCGSTQGAQSAETYEILLNIVSQLHSTSPNSTTITTTFQSMGRPVTLSSEYRTCSSTGALEKAIADQLRTRLSG